jgi:hypothetical protein
MCRHERTAPAFRSLALSALVTTMAAAYVAVGWAVDCAAAEPAAATSVPAAPVRDLGRNGPPAYLGPSPRARSGVEEIDAAPRRPASAGARVSGAAQLIAKLQAGGADVPRVELAARLHAAGFVTTS